MGLGPGAAISAGIGLTKSVIGGLQARKARKGIDALDRPEYQIPEEFQQNLTEAELAALEGMPAEQKQQAVQNMQRTMATTLAAQSSRKGGLAGMAGTVQSQTDAFSNMISQDALMRQQNKQRVAGARTAMAGEKQQAFQMNQMDPYSQELGALQGQFQAGRQTMYSGIEDMGAAAVTGFGGQTPNKKKPKVGSSYSGNA